jgi:tRNA A-37 threonylcarbamoyl transferase component Bud32
MLFQLAAANEISPHTTTPFTLSFINKGIESTLECQQLVRLLPGKRLVCKATWQNQAVIAKIFFNQRHFSREISALEKLASTGLPCARILSQQSDQKNNSFLLITNYLSNKGDLQNVWDNTRTDPELLQLLSTATRLIHKMHQANCYQKDIHWGNFLLSENGEMHIIDAGQIVFGVLSKQDRLSNLALFFAQMAPYYDHSIAEALDSYPDKLCAGPNLFYTLVSQHREYRIKKFSLKCLRNSTQFLAKQNRGLFSVADRRALPEQNLLREDILNGLITNGQLLKDGNTATVAKVAYSGKLLTIKRYNIKNALHFLKRCFKPSRARRSWQNGNILQLLGINTAKPIALIEKRIGPFQLKSYLITEYLEGILLTDYVVSLENKNQTVPDWLDQQLTQMLTGLWRAGISHGDFKATNFLVVGEKLILIDLDSMQMHTQDKTLQDAIKKDIKRFLKNWGGDTQLHFRKLLDDIKISVFSCSSGV